jgi:hypothetical protein
MARRLRILLGAVALFLAITAAAGDRHLAVIAAPNTGISSLSLGELQLIYRRKRRFLNDGTLLQPVNLPAGNAARRFFSQLVLRHTPEELEDYWHRQYFNGIAPPFVAASDEAVLRFVAGTPGAIGYVPMCLVDPRVKVLLILDGAPDCPKQD